MLCPALAAAGPRAARPPFPAPWLGLGTPEGRRGRHPGALAPKPGLMRLLPGRPGVREGSWPRAAARTGREEASSTLPAVSSAGSQRGKKEALCSSCPPCPSALPAGEKHNLCFTRPRQIKMSEAAKCGAAGPRSPEHRPSPDHQRTGTAGLRPPAPPHRAWGSPGPAGLWTLLHLSPAPLGAAGGWAAPGLCSFQPCLLREGLGGWWGVLGCPCPSALVSAEPPWAVGLLRGCLCPFCLGRGRGRHQPPSPTSCSR